MPAFNNKNKKEWIAECIKTVVGEGKPQDQAIAQCYSMWDQHKKKSKATISFNKDEIIIE